MGGSLVTLPAGARDKIRLAVTVNGEARDLLADPYKTLLEVLREDLGLTGTKHGCELGECGACAVLLDGELQLSCLVPAVECEGRQVTTVEGLKIGPELSPLQEAFADHGGSQCGYCTSGMLMAATWLLGRKPDPTRQEIQEALAGQLCRCTGYQQIYEAVESGARVLRGEKPLPPTLSTVVEGGGHG
ncbi:MAG: (2Fe-2S)-binding protein [Deltaproteobacteria bacterium]|nr:(2Fe-2S)-binding protein [Deltaproteobacteria bacterium]